MLKCTNTQQSHADYSTGAMETENHSNGANPKSQMSRGNFLMSVKERTLNFLILILLCATAINARGSCETPIANGDVDNLTWTLCPDGTFTISGTGMMSNLYSYPWDSYKGFIYTLVIEANVMSIGNSAFANCTNLTEVTIAPNSGNIIFGTLGGITCFSGCDIETLNLGRSINPSSNSFTFQNMKKLTKLTFGNISPVPPYTFSGCIKLPSVIFPSSMACVNDDVFSGCSSLESITINATSFTIGNYAFKGCGFEKLLIPASVSEIGNGAFANCTKLTEVTIADASSNIRFGTLGGITCFNGCDIETLNLGRSINPYSNSFTFQNMKMLTKLTFGNISPVPPYTFSGCIKLPSVIFPSSMACVNDDVFSGCSSLESITINATSFTIGNYAFKGCGFEKLLIPASVSGIGNGAFANCTKLTEVTIADASSNIRFGTLGGITCFNGCDIGILHLGRNINSYSNSFTFQNNMALDTLIIGKYVDYIPDYTFSGCCNLKQIKNYPTKPPKIYKNTFDNCIGKGRSKSIPVLIEDCKYASIYKEEEYWSEFENWRDFNNNECNVGIAEVAQSSGLIIYPNPTSDELIIRYEMSDTRYEILDIEIFDVMGRKVTTPSFGGAGVVIDVSHLPTGVYLIRIQIETGMVTRKMVKM